MLLHSEYALLTDTILATPETVFQDKPHFEFGIVAGELMTEYYRQRASLGGLLIAEATAVSPFANAYEDAPGMHDSDPRATFRYLAMQLNPLELAYLHIIEPRIVGPEDREAGDCTSFRS